jgi:glycosyltransferase involved in cell wall biosynthesis
MNASSDRLTVIVATTNFPTKRLPHKGVFLQRDVQGLVANGHLVTCLVGRSLFRSDHVSVAPTTGLKVVERRYLSLSYVPALDRQLTGLAQRNSTKALRPLVESYAASADVFYAKFLNTAPLLDHVPRSTARILGVGEGLGSIQNRLKGFREGELKRCLRAADLVEVKNQEVADFLETEYDCGEKLRVVPSGVDTDVFRPGDKVRARDTLGIAPDAFVIAMIGSRNSNKGGGRLIDACGPSAPGDWLMAMAGPGWYGGGANRLELGEVSPETIRNLLEAADVFAMLSLSEGMPNALLEALSSGLPCIVSQRAYSDFLRDGEDCLKVDPLSPQAIRGALETLYASASLRQRLGTRGRAVAETLSQRKRVQRLEAILCEAVRLRGGKR